VHRNTNPFWDIQYTHYMVTVHQPIANTLHV
jgi:hypothetical protein